MALDIRAKVSITGKGNDTGAICLHYRMTDKQLIPSAVVKPETLKALLEYRRGEHSATTKKRENVNEGLATIRMSTKNSQEMTKNYDKVLTLLERMMEGE